MRMTTILRPGAKRNPYTGLYSVRDFIAVPAIDTYGRWDIKDLIPTEQMAKLAAWANESERKRTSNVQRMTVVGKGRR